MSNRPLAVILTLTIIALLAGAVFAMRAHRADESSAAIRALGVNIDTRGSDVKVDAPYTKIEKNSDGTRIQAPGVDINLPPAPKDNE